MNPVEKSVTHFKEIQSKEETVQIIFYVRVKRGASSKASLARVDIIKQKGHKGARNRGHASYVATGSMGGLGVGRGQHARPDMN